jgi:hypothetical protein
LELKKVSKSVAGETHIFETDLVFAPGSFNVLLGPTMSCSRPPKSWQRVQAAARISRPCPGGRPAIVWTARAGESESCCGVVHAAAIHVSFG